MNKRKILSFLCLILLFNTGIAQSEDERLIQKLEKREYPDWFTNAKLGIFIHWGLYSVPAYGGKESYGEWFLRGLQTKDSLRTNFMKDAYGEDFTYNDFTTLFRAELFEPDEWARLFKKAGAKYVVLVSKHHDGYTLWPSKYSRNWNSVDTGPHRDIVKDLTEAVREEGLKMGLYYSLPEWNHPLHRWYSDPHDSIQDYVENHMIPQFKELVSTYRPTLIFSDGEWYNSAEQWHSAELINWYYDLVGSNAIVNNRWGHGIDTGFLTPEYSSGITETNRPWAEVRGIGRSFGLNRNEDLEAYGTSAELIKRFVITVANGGGMILNVGPKADGQIPLIQQERLMQLGRWLDINGEAIYGSIPFDVQTEEVEIEKKRIDENIDFDWVRNSPDKDIREDDFSGNWKTYLVVPESGKYTLKINADDEASVSIDGKKLINKYDATENQAEAMRTVTGNNDEFIISLMKNKVYPLVIEFNEHKQNAHFQLLWKTPMVDSFEIIPPKVFFLNKNLSESGLYASYRSKSTSIAYTQKDGNVYATTFFWPENELVLKIPNPGSNASISLLGLDRKLNWKYENGELKINTSTIKFNELPSYDAWTFKIQK
ncbi:alpha-L-fucosidase [Gramella jeungdoensis]|uniref:alpha-L-fucosidase n=1 Tax=Gramella jeungdoensis TaxID=708091 RepID=A0ABT0Z3S5_9FLAO|nr:alpha-L-fucosidase [Gramella jeungdoensis]MCM8570386.1 alpha-L-fucosidase [Gramella jeungdoensis]